MLHFWCTNIKMDTTETRSLLLKDVDQIQNLCMRITSNIIDGKPGIEEQDLNWLEKTKYDYKLAIAANRGKNLSKKKEEYIEKNGLRNIPLAEAEIGIELVEALSYTSLMINETNPSAIRDSKFQGDAYVDVCTEANRQFTDFFIKVHKKQSLTDDETIQLFDTIFVKVGLDAELKARALDKFPGGVVAAVRSYLEIRREIPDWDIGISTHEEDKHCAVDLVAVSPDGTEKRYYGVKGSRIFGSVSIAEVTEMEQMEKVRGTIALSPLRSDEKTSQEAALYNIFEYTHSGSFKEPKIRAFWVEAPSSF